MVDQSLYKVCTKCSSLLPLSEYYGSHAECKTCFKIRAKAHRDANKETTKDYQATYNKVNKLEIKMKKKAYMNKRADHFKELERKRYLRDRDSMLEKDKQYRQKNKEALRDKARERYNTNIQFRLRSLLRSRLRKAVSRNSKRSSALVLLGCDIEELKLYLEGQFIGGMSWENFGFGSDKWNIDHIMPCVSFDLENIEEQKKCFHYSNLQPLWQKDNFSKGAKLQQIIEIENLDINTS